ncbi:type II CAAX prenyl endopeptidase Rce1 family protein [Tsuneonella mangrovi]|uniref:CPBP family glutamic-type intramembrane protease n=1 Tax=Tsuneonella mangrovi TaxID=1982042 RepID=UPI001237244B|nr:CPBP family glutamic-type intramembrane protease [Tsuneonella mangrovi]
MAEQGPLTPRDKRVLALVLALGVVGIASLLAVPLERLGPPGIDVPRAVFLIQPGLLVALAALAGWWAAPKVGLETPVLAGLAQGGGWKQPLLRASLPASLGAVLSAGVLLGYARLTEGVLPPKVTELPMPLVTRVFYGGLAEEIIARYGVLSLTMLGLLKLRLGRLPAFWFANLVSALLFAVGHFGLLFAVVPNPSAWLLAAVMAGNTIPALVFGWLFARRGLVAAMLAHGGGHALFVGLTGILALAAR